MNAQTSTADVIIIGAGLSGLGCALALARAGLRVSVLERASRVGGRARSPEVDTMPMNLGAHALYLGGPGEAWLEALGVVWTGFQPGARDTWLADGDAVFPAPGSVFSLVASRRFSLGERLGLMRFFATLDHVDAATLAARSTNVWLDEIAPGARARRFLETMVRLTSYTNAPDRLPAATAVRQMQLALGLRSKGVVYLDGGWQSLVDDLEARAGAAGVSITTEAHVERVTGDAHVLMKDGRSLAARHVIVALPARAARAMCGSTASEEAPLPTPARAATIDMVLDRPPARRLVLGMDEPYYFSVHSPAGATARIRAHAHRYLAPGETGADYIDQVQRWAARVVPGLAATIVARRMLPEMEVMSALPDPAVPPPPPLDRVSFAGDWPVTSHVLLDAVAASALAATERALKSPKVRAAA